jgi:hypothetical protein
MRCIDVFRLNRFLFSFIVIFIIVGLLSSVTFAERKLPDFYSAKDTKSTSLSKCFLNITKPDMKTERKVSTFGKDYYISGYTEDEGVKVMVLVYDSKDGEYKPYVNPKDEEDSEELKIGASGLFMKVVQLDLGVNKIRIVARKQAVDESKEWSYQVTNFKIKRLNNDDMMNAIKEDMDGLFDTIDI